MSNLFCYCHRRFLRSMLSGIAVLWLASASVALAANGASTADHSKFKELQQTFTSGPDVTKACLACHTEAAKQIHKTKHWTWEFVHPVTGQKLGKKHIINNFCTSVTTNMAACATCHVGYGWKDDSFDFTSETNVDCLICHDTTGQYRKAPGKAGHPLYVEQKEPSGIVRKPVDLTKVAQNVGKTSRDTCGACHFYGGGGDGVKHGDLDSTLAAPEKALDVHMDATGADFTCSTCHATSGHNVPGSRYTPTAQDTQGAEMRGRDNSGRNPATCESCHGASPHRGRDAEKLDTHARRVACQTCHIPAMARGGRPTKLSWDWSTAGRLSPDGKPFSKKDAKGYEIYSSIKGDFILGENVVPEYRWFNGEVHYTLLSDKLDKSAGVTPINHFGGRPDDPKSMIWPVKVFKGNQPYDPVYKNLLIAHTAGNDETAYWKNFDWPKAVQTGMDAVGMPFSGKVDFIRTEMLWPITHMVAPKEKALGCAECHVREGGRLAGIEGVYMPGRDRSVWLDFIGWALAAAALIGVVVHAVLRMVANGKH